VPFMSLAGMLSIRCILLFFVHFTVYTFMSRQNDDGDDDDDDNDDEEEEGN